MHGRSSYCRLLGCWKLTEILDEGGAVDTIYISISLSPSDTRSMTKLKGYVVAGQVLQWIDHFWGEEGSEWWWEELSGWADVLRRIPQGSLFRACALGVLHKRHARKHKILSDCSCKLKSIRFCAMTLTNRPAPLYTVGNLQAEPTYVVFMVPLAAPRN